MRRDLINYFIKSLLTREDKCHQGLKVSCITYNVQFCRSSIFPYFVKIIQWALLHHQITFFPLRQKKWNNVLRRGCLASFSFFPKLVRCWVTLLLYSTSCNFPSPNEDHRRDEFFLMFKGRDVLDSFITAPSVILVLVWHAMTCRNLFFLIWHFSNLHPTFYNMWKTRRFHLLGRN